MKNLSNKEQLKESSLFQTVLAGIAGFVVLTILAAIFIRLFYSHEFILYTLAFILLLLSFAILRWMTVTAGVLFIIFSIVHLSLLFFVNTETLFTFFRNPEVINIAGNEKINGRHGDIFYLREMTMQENLVVSDYFENYNNDGGSSSTDYVVPIVPDKWTTGDSISYWITGTEHNSNSYPVPFKYSQLYKAMKAEKFSGRSIKYGGANYKFFLEIIRKNAAKNGISILNDPIIISFHENPEQQIIDDKKQFVYIHAGLLGAWIFFVFLSVLFGKKIK